MEIDNGITYQEILKLTDSGLHLIQGILNNAIPNHFDIYLGQTKVNIMALDELHEFLGPSEDGRYRSELSTEEGVCINQENINNLVSTNLMTVTKEYIVGEGKVLRILLSHTNDLIEVKNLYLVKSTTLDNLEITVSRNNLAEAIVAKFNISLGCFVTNNFELKLQKVN